MRAAALSSVCRVNDIVDRVSARDTDWDGVRLHVVTGKGGTGKTTVAAALALALAAGGRKVLLIEVEGRQGIAQLFDCPPLPYEERKVAVAPEGGDVYALAVDPEEAMLEYLEMFYNLRRAASSVTTWAPARCCRRRAVTMPRPGSGSARPARPWRRRTRRCCRTRGRTAGRRR